VVNFLFLLLGAALYIYASQNGIDVQGDNLFPTVAIQLSPIAGIVFIVGLISALYPSADGALTSLTTAFSIDFLNLEQRENFSERKKERVRHLVHLGFALLFIGIVIFYNYHKNKYLIDILFQISSITYGPLLGLFAFGFLTKRKVRDRFVPVVCILSPIICFILNRYSAQWFGYSFDFELLLLNGLLTFLGLLSISFFRRSPRAPQ
jgi:Na+/proline symporter